MKILRYTSGTKARCRKCSEVVFIFCRDIYSGDQVDVNQIYQDKGQAPWTSGERLICRKCGNELSEKGMFFEPEDIQ